MMALAQRHPHPMAAESRQHDRIPIRMPLTLRLLYRDNPEAFAAKPPRVGAGYFCHTTDISNGGVCVQMPSRQLAWRPGTELEIGFAHTPKGRRAQVLAAEERPHAVTGKALFLRLRFVS